VTGFKALPGQVGSLGYLALPVLKPLPVCALSRMPNDSKTGLWKIIIIGIVFFVGPVSGGAAARPDAGPNPMVRTELYFGAVPKDQWDNFLARVVTPLFPEGLTWYDVQGQWRAPDGVTR
jgi:hypothetical protein